MYHPETSTMRTCLTSEDSDFDRDMKFGQQLYFGELAGGTLTSPGCGVDMEYGWRLYFNQLPEQTSPSTGREDGAEGTDGSDGGIMCGRAEVFSVARLDAAMEEIPERPRGPASPRDTHHTKGQASTLTNASDKRLASTVVARDPEMWGHSRQEVVAVVEQETVLAGVSITATRDTATRDTSRGAPSRISLTTLSQALAQGGGSRSGGGGRQVEGRPRDMQELAEKYQEELGRVDVGEEGKLNVDGEEEGAAVQDQQQQQQLRQHTVARLARLKAVFLEEGLLDVEAQTLAELAAQVHKPIDMLTYADVC